MNEIINEALKGDNKAIQKLLREIKKGNNNFVNDLVIEAQKGNGYYIELIVLLNQKLVHDVVRGTINRIERKNINFKLLKEDYEEIVNSGLYKLVEIIPLYNPSKNTKFTTFAYKCIINESTRLITKIIKKEKDLSLDIELPDSEETMACFYPSKENVEQEVLLKERNEILNDSFIKNKKINERDYKMIKMYFYDEMTYQQIANHFNVSRQAVNKNVIDKTKKAKEYFKKHY